LTDDLFININAEGNPNSVPTLAVVTAERVVLRDDGVTEGVELRGLSVGHTHQDIDVMWDTVGAWSWW
jgi:hypothetical protein